TEIRGLYPPRSHLDHSPHHQHDLESVAAGIGAEGRRRPPLRAVRREIRSAYRQWRPRNLDPGQGVKRFRAKACPALDAGWKPVRVKKTRQIEIWSPGSDLIRTEALVRTRGCLARSHLGDCLASDIDFAITLRNEIVARAEMSPGIRRQTKKPGGFRCPMFAFSPPISNFRKGRWRCRTDRWCWSKSAAGG